MISLRHTCTWKSVIESSSIWTLTAIILLPALADRSGDAGSEEEDTTAAEEEVFRLLLLF